MNKIVRAIESARSRFSYRQPVYIQGYQYSPWKRVVVIILALFIIIPPVIAHFFFHKPNAMAGLFTFLFCASFVTLIWGLIAPSHLSSKIMPVDKELSRRGVATTFGMLSLVFFIMVGITAPASADTKTASPSANPGVSTNIVAETKVVPYTTITQYDTNLPEGQTQVVKDGIDGVETYSYIVTFNNGKESNRTLKSKSITTEPISKVVAVGTRTAAPSPASSSQNTGYTNSDGNRINSPSADPAGASAQCNDGSYSYSAHRRGTCSHHGGVARWL